MGPTMRAIGDPVRCTRRERDTVDSAQAREIADDYLVDHVGNLLWAGPPQLSGSGEWIMPILLSTIRQGEIGSVGTIAVDAETGEVLFSNEDRLKVKASARRLAGSPAP